MLFGAHESISGGISRAFERAAGHRAKSLQIFTKSARGWACGPLEQEEREAFLNEARRTGIPSIAHGSYLANLEFAEQIVRDDGRVSLKLRGDSAALPVARASVPRLMERLGLAETDSG